MSEGPADEREEWQEKLAYIQSYLEQSKDSDSHSVTTETSDSGMAESRVAPSEFGMEETSGNMLIIMNKVFGQRMHLGQSEQPFFSVLYFTRNLVPFP